MLYLDRSPQVAPIIQEVLMYIGKLSLKSWSHMSDKIPMRPELFKISRFLPHGAIESAATRTPLGWIASPSQGYCEQYVSGTPILYTWVNRDSVGKFVV